VGRLVLVLAAIACVAAPVASAKRAPTGGEAKAIRLIVAGFVASPGSPAAKDDKVASIAVSTLDAHYASARIVSPTVGPSEMVFHWSRGTWFVVAFGSSPACSSAPKTVLADLGVGCSPPSSTAWIWNCGPLASAPEELVITCADANYELAGLHWHGWGTARATATGTARANDCTPNCAAGHFHSYRMTAVADKLRSCGAARVYGRLTITYAGPRPKGIAKRDVVAPGC